MEIPVPGIPDREAPARRTPNRRRNPRGGVNDPAADAVEAEPAQTPDPDEKITLKFATGASEIVPALNEIFTNYNAEHPNVTIEVTVLPGGVAGFNSAMGS